jgi:hypothetical protein
LAIKNHAEDAKSNNRTVNGAGKKSCQPRILRLQRGG